MARVVEESEIYCKYTGKCEFRYRKRYGESSKLKDLCLFKGKCSQQSMFVVAEEVEYQGEE